jgi:DNA-binding transcriptional LysR family regulator
MPDLQQLRTFVAVAEHLSFTRAAESLEVTQQAVSRSVRALEDELGVVLLERTTREVRVTAAGAALVEEAHDLLSRADAAVARVRDVEDGLAGTVTVGVTPAIGLGDRMAAVDALRDGRPELRVSLREVRPAQLRPLLRAGELTVALSRARGLDDPAIDARPLRPTPMVLCVPTEHRLARETEVAPSALDGERLLVPSPVGTPYTDMLLARLVAAGADVDPVEAHVTGGGAILWELAATGTVALMPRGTAVPADVVRVALTGGLTLPLYVLWAGGRPSPAAQQLIRLLPPV